MELEVGQEASGFRILEVLGQGGMGVVYKATDLALARDVALKVIKPDLARDEQFVKRFQTEARVLAKVNSPNIVGVHALRQTDDGLFIVMEYVEGGDLSDLLKDEPLPVPKAIDVTRQLLGAIERAHKAGVVHRDIKPQNIMMSGDGQVKVTDFGLAKLRQSDMMSTMTQGVVGTLYYMSPEQIRGEELDARTDLWAVGVVLYEMLAGQRPFVAEHEAGVMHALLYKDLNIPEEVVSRLPAGLVEIIIRSLAKNQSERYQSASEMLADLDALERGAEPQSAPVAEKPAAQPGSRRWGRLVAAFVVVAAVAAASYYFLGGPPSEEPVQPTLFSVVTSPTGARVVANGTLLGSSPIVNHPVAAGLESLRVEISQDGFESLDTLLLAGGTYTLALAEAELPVVTERTGSEPRQPEVTGGQGRSEEPEPVGTVASDDVPTEGTLLVSVLPDIGATVQIEDNPPRQPGSFTLPAGRYLLRFKTGNYGEIEHTVDVPVGGQETVACHFERRIGLQSGTTWATVYVNDERTQLTTPTEMILGPGEYTITLRRFGYSSSQVSGPNVVRVPSTCGEKPLVTLVFEMTQS